MFTGIVEEVGEIVDVTPLEDSARLRIRGPLVTSDARAGDSIAVNGVCLTVVDPEGDTFGVDVMGETLSRSSLGRLVKPAGRAHSGLVLGAEVERFARHGRPGITPPGHVRNSRLKGGTDESDDQRPSSRSDTGIA